MRVRCKRLSAEDKPASEPIVDALCCAVHAARERGRVHLDEHGSDKEMVRVSAPFRGAPARGSVIEVHDNESGEPYRAALRGVRIKAAVEGGTTVVSTELELERSLSGGET